MLKLLNSIFYEVFSKNGSLRSTLGLTGDNLHSNYIQEATHLLNIKTLITREVLANENSCV